MQQENEFKKKLQLLAESEKIIEEKISRSYPSVEEFDLVLDEVFGQYYEIYEEYAMLSSKNLEALKRAVFIQWYSISEPDFNTGIPQLDPETESEVLSNVYYFIENGLMDDEFIWMLNYYLMWDYIFKRVSGYKGFDPKLINEKYYESYKVNKVNLEEMKTRGSMGRYWTSIFEQIQ